MSRDPASARRKSFGSRVGQAIRGAQPMRLLKRQRIRISFDIDDTLACQLHHCDVEQSRLPACVHRWLGEPLRMGTRSLIRDLRRQGCSIWVYTSSGRTPSYIRRWLLLYGIRVDGVVNSVLHNRALTVHGMCDSPSKYPPAFDIDLHVDDSEGVQIEGNDHGFRVVVVHPEDEGWAQKVLDAVARVQVQLDWQQRPVQRASLRRVTPV